MNITKINIGSKAGTRIIFVFSMLIFFFIGITGFAQIDSRNQIRPDREQNAQNPDKKKSKRIKSKKNPRFKGKKAYSNKKQVKRAKRDRAKNVDKSPRGDIAGRKVKSKRTPRTTIARQQPDTYKNRRIRTEKSRAGPPAPEVRSATRKGENVRKGDISGQKRVRQRGVNSVRTAPYPQPNPYVGRTIRTEKKRAKSNKRQLQSIRSVSRPSESRRPKIASRPVSATAAPKIRTKSQRNVYRNHDRRGGEKSTDKDISGRKLRTKNTRSAQAGIGGIKYAGDPYHGRGEYREGTRFKRSRALPASARSITRSAESGNYKRNNAYATHKNYRSPRITGVVKAKAVRSRSQPSGRGEKTIYGNKYRSTPPRSISGYSKKKPGRSYMPPISVSGNRRSYKQKNTYKGKDKHFGENASTKDIAGRRLRTRNYRSTKPNGTASGFRPYYGRSAPMGRGKNYSAREIRSIKRARWNNGGQPIFGRGRSANGEAISGYKGSMPLSAIPGYGSGKEGSYSGNIRAKSLRKYSGGGASLYAGRTKSKKRLKGGGSITRHWNNGGNPLLGRGRSANGEAVSRYKGKMPIGAMPTYTGSKEGSYAGRMKAKKPLKGGGSITRHWNNGGNPLLGRGRSANGEAVSGYQGKMPLSAMPNYKGSKEGSYAGNMKAKKPLKGGGSITRHWNNGGNPLLGRGRSANGEAMSAYQGKMPLSAMPNYSGSKEGSYAGNMKAKKPLKGGGGSITMHWNNNNQPLIKKSRGSNGEAPSNYQGSMPLREVRGFGGGNEAVYQGNMKVKKSPKKTSTSYGRRTKMLFVYIGREAGYMEPRKHYDNDNENLITAKVPQKKIQASDGMDNGRKRSLAFLHLGNPRKGGLHPEHGNYSRNSNLPKNIKGKNRTRITASEGTRRGRTQSLSFIALGNPTKGGLVYHPYSAKGRMHPSSNYTTGNKPRNAVEEKAQPVKIKIWWAKLFKKNGGQPDSVKEKPRRPRYDKGERLIWETADRPNWYDN